MDETILRSINALAEVPFFATLAVVLSSTWFAIAVGAPVAVLLARSRRWIAMLSVALAIGVSDAVSSQVLKPIVGRERPCRTLSELVQPVKCGRGKSFPSNHAVNAFAFLFATAPLFRLGWPILAPIAVAIAGSRLVLGVHYPTDLIGGAAVGSTFGALFGVTRKRLEAKMTNRLPSANR